MNCITLGIEAMLIMASDDLTRKVYGTHHRSNYFRTMLTITRKLIADNRELFDTVAQR